MDGSTKNEHLQLAFNIVNGPLQCVNVQQEILTNWWIVANRDVSPSSYLRVSDVKLLPERGSTEPLYVDNFYIGKQPLQCKFPMVVDNIFVTSIHA